MADDFSKKEKRKGFSWLLSIVLVFCILGTVVFSVAQKISQEMSDSAIQNLSESLDLIECTIEAILCNEAEFQKLVAKQIAMVEDPEEYIRAYQGNQTMVKMSLVLSGETEGISNIEDSFSASKLDFSAGKTVDGLPISQSYLNYMGTWAYTIKCPVEKEGRQVATLYVEYVYDFFDKSLPEGFYNQKATLYVMDAENERFVLKPKGMGQRSAGHLNLDDFYRANDIREEKLRAEVTRCLEGGENLLFYHDIRQVNALNYMWPVNDGSIFLVGYVPVEAIQQEGRSVNQNIFIVVTVMLVAFFLCCLLYYVSQKQQEKIRKEREAERETHNRQLAEALQAAQMASNSKTMFLSNMSHDIRTPMNAVLGFTRLLALDAENPARVREYTKKIMASGQHLLSLINDVLDVSKIESGKVVLTFVEFTLNDLVAAVDAIIQPMAKAKDQKFHVEVTGVRHERLVGDETRLNQVLLNLLSNAVKYTQAGGNIWFRILGLKQRSSQYEHLCIEVEDDGFGMTPEFLETIFDAFTRAENSTTNKVQGTGLGMAITKSIVELMGGTIDVSSEVDKGSLLRVELELRIPEGQTDVKFWEESGISRVLVVERDLEAGKNIQELMGEVGVLVDIASSVEEGLSLPGEDDDNEKKLGYQLALLSWETAGKQGAMAVREALPEEVPLMLLAASDEESLEAGLQVPNTHLLTKPFFVSAFKEKLLEMRNGPKENGAHELVGENSLEGLRFLAAEDNEINAEILAEVLEIEGASCEIVENGRLAVERFEASEEGEFDAILMDVQMPVINGYDATRAIRALERADAGKIPIIAMTANAFAEDERAALEAGMDAHVAKPLDMELLRKAISQCTNRKE